MYNCSICKKTCDSTKQLSSHVKRCQKRRLLVDSDTINYRSDQIITGSGSDVQNDKKYTDISDLIGSDQIYEIRELTEPVRNLRSGEPPVGLRPAKSPRNSVYELQELKEKCQNYEIHIDGLTIDNDMLLESLEVIKKEKNEIKAKIRKQYAKKLAIIKLDNDSEHLTSQHNQTIKELETRKEQVEYDLKNQLEYLNIEHNQEIKKLESIKEQVEFDLQTQLEYNLKKYVCLLYTSDAADE